MSSRIKCPSCNKSFELSEAMASQIKDEVAGEFAEKEAELAAQVAKLEKDFQTRLKAEAAAARRAGYENAEEDAKRKQDDLENALAETKDRLAKAQQAEMVIRKQQRALEQDKADFELLMTRKMDEERARIKGEVGAKIAEEFELKALEYQKKQSDMETLISELKRKAEQSSQQGQGEALELEIENMLRTTFTHDEIAPIGKGIKGSDIVQRVQHNGVYAGSIAWELKNTRSFSDAWIGKIKDDARNEKADVAVIITAVLPKGAKSISCVDGVWVVSIAHYLGLAAVLRSGLFELAKARASSDGRKDKASALYSYISGNEFRARVEQVVEAFVEMQEDLDAEKRALDKIWAKRAKQTARALGGMAAMYGEVQAQVGHSLTEIKALSLDSIA